MITRSNFKSHTDNNGHNYNIFNTINILTDHLVLLWTLK